MQKQVCPVNLHRTQFLHVQCEARMFLHRVFFIGVARTHAVLTIAGNSPGNAVITPY